MVIFDLFIMNILFLSMLILPDKTNLNNNIYKTK